MTEPLSPDEIVTHLYDSGLIDKGVAERLKRRITAHGDARASQGLNEGIAAAAPKAQAVVYRIKSATQRAASEQVLRAVQRLLPQAGSWRSRAYSSGYQHGATDERRRQSEHIRPRHSKEQEG